MSTILKAVPGHPEINISYLDQNIRFIGNDVRTIRVGEVRHGSCLTIDTADSLEEIHIQKSGAIVTFNKFPNQTIRIKGAFEEIRVQDNKEHYALHRFGSSPTLPLDNVWGATITSDPNIECEKMDALMIKTKDNPELKLDGEWSHISIIGDKTLASIEVEGKRTIQNFVVHKGPRLESVNIRRRALTCSLMRCPFINTIIGFGDRLNLHPKPRKKNSLSIGGFWHRVPEWYDLQVALLQIPHFNAHLNANDIIDCGDMGGIRVTPYNYDGLGGLCQFESAFGIGLDELSLGIEIQQLIALIETNPERGFDALWSWSSNNLSLFDQYKVMRILASLISRGFNSEPIIKLRNLISDMNIAMPKLIIGTVNDGHQGGRWKPLYSGDSEDWETPSHSVMPFGRVDLEIWLNTSLGIEFLGIDKSLQSRPQYIRRRHLGENSVIRNILISTLSAANSVGRTSKAELKLTNLAEGLYTNPIINTDPFCCEFTVYHLAVSRIATKPIIKQLIEGIMNMQTQSWIKAALLVGIVDQTNSSTARIALKRLASDKEFNVSESTLINAISIAGKRAFETGKAAKPEWPYLKTWQQQNKPR
jgi:hypothetical protein